MSVCCCYEKCYGGDDGAGGDDCGPLHCVQFRVSLTASLAEPC